MTCSKCGKTLPGDAKFCPECGAASSQSGTEADLSLGGLRTLQPTEPAPENSPLPDVSLNSLPTIDTRNPNPQPPISNTETTPLSSRYELLEEIGHGGFAVVWKARDRKLGRIVAVKRLLAEALRGTAGEQTLARFRREAQAIAQLTHRNIVAVYDHDRDAEGDYIVMEYVAGGTLRQHLQAQGGKLPVPEALALIRGIAQGLAYAHRKNLVHRDIKPANILLHREGEETVPKIVDFGLARAGSDSEISQSGYGMGTPWYMPPEQRRDAKGVNHTADIYALGKVLYELASGDVPDNVDPEKVPPFLAKIILKCCKSNPEERYFSCEELLAALESESASRRHGGRGGEAAENACPACGVANAPDVKFCESCGAGMTRICPECERDNSIHKQFCGGCGTDVEGFGKVREALARMERFRDEKRWSRVLKEGGLLEETPSRLPGKKGLSLLAQVSKLKEQAVAEQAKCARLKQVIDESLAGGDFAAAAAAAAGYLETDPHDATLAELAGKIGQAEVLVRKATVAADAGYPPVARAALAELSAIAETKAGVERVAQTIEDRLVRYEQARGLAAQAIGEKHVATALAALDQALAAAPKSAEVMDARREYQEMLRRLEEAVQSAEALVHTDNAAALAACHEALAITPDDARAGELEQWIAKANAAADELRRRAAEVLAARRPDTAQALWAEAAGLDAAGGDAAVGRKITDAAGTVRFALKQAREALALAAVVRAENHARSALARQMECPEAQAVLNACGSMRRRRKMLAIAVAAAVCVVAIGTVAIIQQRRAAIRRTLDTTLVAARQAQAANDWNACLARVGEALAIEAGNTEALALKVEAEAKQELEQRERIAAALAVAQQAKAQKEVERQASLTASLAAARAAKAAGQWRTCLMKATEALGLEAGNAEALALKREAESNMAPKLSSIDDTQTVDLGGGVKLEMVWCPAGTFTMSSPTTDENRADDETQHRVTLTKGFWMGKYEVTQAQWEAVLGSYPSNFKNAGRTVPVECVSWDDCQEFVRKLNARVPGGGFRLPTEAEWEYACRAGTAGSYAGQLDDMAWYSSNSGNTTHPVGQKHPNAWGLYDMHGNVWEWCQDRYGAYPSESVTDPAGSGSGEFRISRGGGCDINARFCRAAKRDWNDPGFRYSSLGLRLARSPQ